MDFANSTTLDSTLLRRSFLSAAGDWPTDPLTVRVRWSRGADFSGSCVYRTQRIYVNLGRHLRYPYALATYCARSRKAWGRYYKPRTFLDLPDGYQLCLFIFAHEFYHWLTRAARRNTSQKESMCDRFATRVLVDQCGCVLRDRHGHALHRQDWDIQDLDRFVMAARSQPRSARPAFDQPAAAART